MTFLFKRLALLTVAALSLSLTACGVWGERPTTLTNGVESVLHSFGNGADGQNPTARLTPDRTGNLVGTTSRGGTNNEGTVFKISPAGVYSVLYSFGAGADGHHPQAGLILDSAGNLVGTTEGGGTSNRGTVFKITPAGVESVLHSFGPNTGTDGQYAEGGLILDSAGNLVGTTEGGGTSNNGAIFKITPSGVESLLYSFSADADGQAPAPLAGLTLDNAGDLVGTTYSGGANDAGTVFRVTAAGVESLLHSFGDGTDGKYPDARLILDRAGDLVGTTDDGGTSDKGTVFKITLAGVYSVLHSFGATAAADGQNPEGCLILDRAGDLVGTTYRGGTNNKGTVFRITPAGVETVLHAFGVGNDSQDPKAGLTMDRAGNMYGTTEDGGTNGTGTVFMIN